jgi:hypothetical protein
MTNRRSRLPGLLSQWWEWENTCLRRASNDKKRSQKRSVRVLFTSVTLNCQR